MLTFQDQSRQFIKGLRESRKGRAQETLKTYQSILNYRLLPLIGPQTLESLNGAAVKQLFDQFVDELSPATLKLILHVFNGVVDSAVDENGVQLYPRRWKTSFLDLPKLSPAEQRTPEIARKTLQEAISGGSPEDKLLWGLLAASGLRIGEALAVTSTPNGPGNYWDRENRLIEVRVQRYEDGTLEAITQGEHEGHSLKPTKTVAGRRIVDLCAVANSFIAGLAPTEGFLFKTGERALRERLNHAVPNTGFHAFRRFRVTQMIAAGVPEELGRFWVGHAAKDVHGLYAKWTSKLEERRDWAERAALGFEL